MAGLTLIETPSDTHAGTHPGADKTTRSNGAVNANPAKHRDHAAGPIAVCSRRLSPM